MWLRKRRSIPDNEERKLTNTDLEVLSYTISGFEGEDRRKGLAEQYSYFREMMLRHFEGETRWAREIAGEIMNGRKVYTWNMK